MAQLHPPWKKLHKYMNFVILLQNNLLVQCTNKKYVKELIVKTRETQMQPYPYQKLTIQKVMQQSYTTSTIDRQANKRIRILGLQLNRSRRKQTRLGFTDALTRCGEIDRGEGGGQTQRTVLLYDSLTQH